MKLSKLLLKGAFAGALMSSVAAQAAVTVEPITWNVIGLDSNKPDTVQVNPSVFPPDRFPVGVNVCNTSTTVTESGLKTVFAWDETPATNYIDLWNSTGTGTSTAYTELDVPELAPGECQDMYYFVRINRVDAAYTFTRDFHIEVWDDSATPGDSALDGTKQVETATPRELYVEYLVSQNRNAIIGYEVDGSPVAKGGSVAVKPGDTIQLVIDAKTATQGYEQLEVFMALPPDLFTINSVRTVYSANSGTDVDARTQLYADGCGWVTNPNDAQYHTNESCGDPADDGKYGGVIQQVYSITISPSFASSVTGQTLIYDFSGSSYHYNADYESGGLTFTVDSNPYVPAGDLSIVKSTDTQAQDEFFLTITNEGASTFPAGALGLVVEDELPVGYETKPGGGSAVEILEFDSAGLAKATQPSAAETDAQLEFYNLSANQVGGPDQSDGPDYDANERHIIWTLATVNDLAPGESVQLAFQVAPNNSAVGDGAFTNCAEIVTSDDDLSNNSSCATLPPPNWDLAVLKQVTSVGANTVTFTVQVTNNGPDASDATMLEDIVPAGYNGVTGLTYAGDVTLSMSARASVASGILLWNVPAMTSGQTASATYTVTLQAPTGSEVDEDDLNARYLNTVRALDAASEPNNGTYDPATDRISLLDLVVENNKASASAAPSLLQIDKTPDTGVISGSTYNYALTVTNNGAFQVGDLLTVVEAPPPGMRITAVSGTGWTCTTTLPTVDNVECDRAVASETAPHTYDPINVTVELDPVPTGAASYTNTTFVEATRTGTALFNTFDTDSVIATVPASKELTLIKAITQNATYSTVGTVIQYSYTVSNTGGADLPGPITVADDVINGVMGTVSCPDLTGIGDNDTDLDVGETVVCTASYTVTQADLNAGSVVNVASASASDGTKSNNDTETATATQNPGLTLVKAITANATYSAVDDVIAYSFTVTNSGNVSLAGPVTIADDQTTGETCPAVTSVGNSDGNLDPGEVIVCTASYTVTQADINAGSVVNIASASADGTDSNDDTATATASQTPGLTLVKAITANATYSAVDDVIAYSFTVTNSGNVSLAGPVTIADDQTTDETCPALSTVGNNDDNLDPGEVIVCTASYTVTQADLDAGSVVNVATASADGTDSNEDTATANADQQPSLSLVKAVTAGDDYAAVDDVIEYSFTVTNDGNVSLAGPVVINDDKTTDETCPALSTVGNNDDNLDPGETIVCTASYAVTQTDLDAKQVVNKATASADGTDSNEDTAIADRQPLVTLSGRVFEEINTNYDGLLTTEQLTNGSQLFVCMASPARSVPVGVPGVGQFEFTDVDPNQTYELTLNADSSCSSTSVLQSGWYSTGESADGVTTDSTVVPGESISDGKVSVAVADQDVDTVTFGVVQANIYDPPFGVKKGVLNDDQTLIAWTMVWVNDSPISVGGAVVSDVIDEAASGMTYVGDENDLNCYGEGGTIATTQSVTGLSGTPGTRIITISCAADFAPDAGKDEVTGANKLYIAFDVAISDLYRSYENQATLSWTPRGSTTPKTSVSDDKPQTGAKPGDDDPTEVTPVPPPIIAPTPVPATPWQLLMLMSLMLGWMGYSAKRRAS